MPTIDQTIAQIEAELDAAKRHYSEAREEIKLLIERGEQEGRSAMTDDERRRSSALFRSIDDLKRTRASLQEKLADAYRVKAEEEQSNADAADTHRVEFKRSDNGTMVAVENASPQVGRASSSELRSWSFDQTRSASPSSPTWVEANTGRNAALRSDQRFNDHDVVREDNSRNAERDRILTGTHGTLAQQIRSLSTSSGSAIVPTSWAGAIIDKVRNAAVTLRAGVTVVPMPSKVYQIGRLNQDITPSFRTEGSSIAASDPGFDYVQLSAKTLSALTVASVEFLQDAPNADNAIQDAIAKAMALEIDKAVLFGGLLTADGSEGFNLPSPYPTGILKRLLSDASSNVLGNATNGTSQTAASYFRELQNLVFSLKRRNENPGVLVSNDALQQIYVDAYDANYRPLEMPANLRQQGWLTTNAIPSNTQGTGTNMTDVFCGDWSQVLVGQRLGLEIRVLHERYAELGQVGIMAYWRGDVQLARLSAMGVYRYLEAAA